MHRLYANTPFYIRDLNIRGFGYPQGGSWYPLKIHREDCTWTSTPEGLCLLANGDSVASFFAGKFSTTISKKE